MSHHSKMILQLLNLLPPTILTRWPNQQPTLKVNGTTVSRSSIPSVRIWTSEAIMLFHIDHIHLPVFVDPKPQLFQLWRPALLPLVIVHPWSSLFFSYFLVSLSLAFISAPPNRLLVLLLPNINQSQKLVLAPHYVITYLYTSLL